MLYFIMLIYKLIDLLNYPSIIKSKKIFKTQLMYRKQNNKKYYSSRLFNGSVILIF